MFKKKNVQHNVQRFAMRERVIAKQTKCSPKTCSHQPKPCPLKPSRICIPFFFY